MGILNSGINGPMRNKAGAVVGRMSRGQNIVSGLPRTSDKPGTEPQLLAREQLILLSQFLNSISNLVNPGFKQYRKKGSALNAAYAYNFEQAFVFEEDKVILNYPAIVYSRGHVKGALVPSVTLEEGMAIFKWQEQQESNFCRFSDQASFLLVAADTGKAAIFQNVTRRDACGFTVALPAKLKNTALHAYMNFSSADGKLVGNSRYVGPY
ncbi:DUF6266 family protein [Pedobacter sp. GR22-6]|uniref:DUF6266 family protein n=1 Tax=Pedobacter sp. GR22-6 TaxID=3127957 RepID=UPI00307D1673